MSESIVASSTNTNKVTWADLLSETAKSLEENGIDSYKVEAQWIIETASGFSREEFLKNIRNEAPLLGVKHLNKILSRRLSGEPIQYALGSWSFRELDLLVDHRVLIPRPETETLVDVAHTMLSQFDRRSKKFVCDLGAGSGAIGLAIAQERNDVEVYLVEKSAEALKVASANLAGLGNHAVKVKVFHSCWFDELPRELRNSFHLIVSNPPYIADSESLPNEVANFEPHEALFAGEKGTEYIETILLASPKWLMKSGGVVLEMAPDQTDSMAETARELGYSSIEISKDLTGKPRIMSCVWGK